MNKQTPHSDDHKIITMDEYNDLNPHVYYGGSLPPLNETVFLWTGKEWLLTHLWRDSNGVLRWNCMGPHEKWPVWVKVKHPKPFN